MASENENATEEAYYCAQGSEFSLYIETFSKPILF